MSGGIIASIQISETGKMWDECPATLHECKDWNQAATVAQAIANTTGCQVRVTKVDNTHVTQEMIGRLNGHYFNRKLSVPA